MCVEGISRPCAIAAAAAAAAAHVNIYRGRLYWAYDMSNNGKPKTKRVPTKWVGLDSTQQVSRRQTRSQSVHGHSRNSNRTKKFPIQTQVPYIYRGALQQQQHNNSCTINKRIQFHKTPSQKTSPLKVSTPGSSPSSRAKSHKQIEDGKYRGPSTCPLGSPPVLHHARHPSIQSSVRQWTPPPTTATGRCSAHADLP